MKDVRVVLSPNAAEIYTKLKESNEKLDKSILNSFLEKVEILKTNVHYGDPVAKKLIPKEYVKFYEIKNLFRFELPQFFRVTYTITNGAAGIEIVVLVLDIMDHKTYNKKFGYKNR
jgi:mRNA-degrading endonuclease RelE of RelBE toxin-antitoxin system